MKNIFIIILSFLHLASVTGANLYRHYCMDQPAGWGLVKNNDGVCSKCGMKNSKTKLNGCCKDENTFVKLITDQKITENNLRFLPSEKEKFFVCPTFDSLLSPKTGTSFYTIIHAPPYPAGGKIFIRNCVFRI